MSKKVKPRKSKSDNSFFAEFEVNGGKYVIAWEAIDDRELSVKFNIGIQQIIEEVEETDGLGEWFIPQGQNDGCGN